MKSFQVFVVLILTSRGFAYPFNTDESLEPITTNTATTAPATTEFPILKPVDEDFEIPRPSPVEEPVGNGNENAEEDKPVDRPYPVLEKLKLEEFLLTGERRKRSISKEEEDDDTIVIEPIGEDDEDYEDEGNAVVVDAATCGELLQACKEENDLLSCQAYNENCDTNEGDEEQLVDLINCSNDNANGNSEKCPSIHGH